MFAFALLYFTGSDHFNRSMRLFASKKGYSLSDKVSKYSTEVPRVLSCLFGNLEFDELHSGQQTRENCRGPANSLSNRTRHI
jgi:hypothetical protein